MNTRTGMKRDLLSLYDLSGEEIESLVLRGIALKGKWKSGEAYAALKGKVLGLIFAKPSTRTRVSFEAAMIQMGGHSLFLNPQDLQLGRGEPIKDTARVLSRYIDVVVIRTFAQADVEEFARHATIPVINGLTDLLHPCQVLADLMTVLEFKGRLTGLKVAYVGDGNNVANSWVEAAGLINFNLSVASPKGYEPDYSIVRRASQAGRVEVMREPKDAVTEADVVVTDVWASMGREAQAEERRAAFKKYQVNEALMKIAKGDAIVLHCLPAHREEEITEKVFEEHIGEILEEAENRLHVQKAILERLLGGGD